MTDSSLARRLRRTAVGAAALCSLLAAAPAAPAAPPSSGPDAPGLAAPAADVREQQWWLDILSAEEVWREHTRGAGVVVAVIDSGVEPDGDLQGAVLPGFDQTGAGRGDSDADSQEWHGTGMATKIAGRGTGPGLLGVAPEAQVLPVKIPTLNQERYTAQALRTLAAMDDPPEVVNMSYNGLTSCSPDEQRAVRAAVDAGMILVASAGNDGSGPELSRSPADCAGVLAVGAYGYDAASDPPLAMWPLSEQRDYVSLAAPGVDMISVEPDSSEPVYYDGTSDAAAVASGSIALVRAEFPDMPSRELVARLLATALPLEGAAGRSPAWGFGALRPRSAIQDDVPADAPNPVYDALDRAVPPTSGGGGGGGQGGGGGGADAEPPAGDDPAAGDQPASAADAADAAGEDGDGDGVPVGLAAGVGAALVVLLLAAGAVALGVRRRRSTPSGYPR